MKQQRCRTEVLSMSLSRLDLNTVHHPTVIDEFNKHAINDLSKEIYSIVAQRPKPSVDAP
jgi:hypothetical protein